MVRLLLLVALATVVSCERYRGTVYVTQKDYCTENNISPTRCEDSFRNFLSHRQDLQKCDSNAPIYSNRCSSVMQMTQPDILQPSATCKGIYCNNSDKQFAEAASSPIPSHLSGSNFKAPTTVRFQDIILELPAPSVRYNDKVMDFSLKLFQNSFPIDATSNYIISPLMVQSLMSYLIDGASNVTRREMESVLQLNMNDLYDIEQALQPHRQEGPRTKNKLDAASQIFKSTTIKLTPGFQSSLKDNRVPLKDMDFTNPRIAAEIINTWAAQQTRRRITEVVEENSINPDTKLLLINALYFNGTWMTKFPKTERGTFHAKENSQKPVKMMFLTKELRGGNTRTDNPNHGMTWVELPYDGDKMSMILFLPNERFQLDRELRLFTPQDLRNILEEIKMDEPGKVKLELPEFKAESTVSLVHPLKKMGLASMFSDDNPFENLSKDNVKVSDVKQKSFLSVNPYGTVAASVTTATVIPLSITHTLNFKADQPFALIIMDKQNQLPLFFAKISDPLKV